MVKSITNEDNR